MATLVAALAVAIGLLPGPTAVAQGPDGGLTADERAFIDALDVPGAMDWLHTISGMGERIVGSPEEARAQELVRDALAAMPLDRVEMEPFRTTSWSHRGDAIRVVTSPAESISTTIYAYDQGIWGRWFGAPYTRGNRDDGHALEARLVDVGYGTAADFDAAGNVTGAIVLARRDDDIQSWPTPIAEEGYRRGAVAVVNYGYYGDIVHPDGIKQDVSRAPIPEFAISVNAAAGLRERLVGGPVSLRLEGRADAVSDNVGRAANVVAYLEGSTRPDEFILISGHVDCWWSGASDDSSSIAALLELARAFSEAREAGTFVNERTIVFASFAGEEFGGPADTWYDWLTGSYAFVREHPEIMAGLVVDLNMDGVGFPAGPGKYWIEESWEIDGALSDAIGDLGLTGRITPYQPTGSWTDAWALSAKGGGSAVQGFWVGTFDSIYHTQLDDISRVDEEPMRNILELYSLMAMRADHGLVVPLDLMRTVDWAAGALRAERALAPAAGPWFDRPEAALEELREAVAAANARADELREAWTTATTDAQRSVIRVAADALNRDLIEARRTLTSWTLGEGGAMGSWESFLRPEQHARDLNGVQAAITALSTGRGSVTRALAALERVSSMEWGHLFGEGAYHAIMGWIINDEMHWGDDFDQQQAYVDVHAIHAGLRDGTLSPPAAIGALESIREMKLLPWLEADLLTLEQRWLDVAGGL